MTKQIEAKRAIYITQCEVSPKVYASLVRMEVDTLGDLADMERSRALKYRNVGETTVKEMDALLSKNGLSWKEEPPTLTKIIKPKIVEDDTMKERRNVQQHNKKLVAEVVRLTDEVLKSNLEKVRLEGRVTELEEKNQRLVNLLAMK